MSVETDFVDALDAHAPLVALVGENISKNAVAQDADLPLVVYSVSHEPHRGLDGTVHATQSTFQVECWGADGDAAIEVADEVEAALLAHDQAHPTASVAVITRAAIYNEELKLDGEALVVDWWSQ